MLEKLSKKLMLLFRNPDRIDRKTFEQLEVMPRRWGFLWTLDKYVLTEFTIKLSVLLLVFILGFIMGDVFDDLADFLEADAGIYDIIRYFMLKLPGNIRFVLPISMLLGCIWTMATFGKNQEITAMRASGISLFRCGGAIFVVGLIVTGINIYFNEMLVPYTEREAAEMMQFVQKGEISSQKMLVYRSRDSRRAWFFRLFDQNAINEQVTLKNYRPDGTLEWDIYAQNAEYLPDQGWVFRNIKKTTYSLDGLMSRSPTYIDEMMLPVKDASETPEDILNAIKDEEDLPSWVILDLLKRSEYISARLKAIYLTIFYYRLAFPWSCFLAVFLGIPLATKSERSGIMLSIISAVGVIVAYIITAQVFMMLGKQGTINPVFAGLAPTIGFILYGYYKVVFNRN